MAHEKFRLLKHARCIALDYASLRRDIVRSARAEIRADLSEGQLRELLASNCAVLSEQQLQSGGIQSIITTGGEIWAERPPRYLRACVLRIQFSGPDDPVELDVDIKGSGLPPGTEPTPAKNGFLCGYEAIYEYTMGKILNVILKSGGSQHKPLPIYGILDTGLIYTNPDGSRERAHLLLRRAHKRPARSDLPDAGSPQQQQCLEVELTLRPFGISTRLSKRLRIPIAPSGEVYIGEELVDVAPGYLTALEASGLLRRPLEADLPNVQYASDLSEAGGLQLVDLLQYRYTCLHETPIVSAVANMPFYFGGVLYPDAKGFPRPNALAKTEMMESVKRTSDLVFALRKERVAPNFFERAVSDLTKLPPGKLDGAIHSLVSRCISHIDPSEVPHA